VLDRICSLVNDESRLRDYILGAKSVSNFIFLAAPDNTKITTANFKISEIAVPKYKSLSMDLQRHLYDIFDFFRTYTAISDSKSLLAFEAFLKNTDYLQKIVLTNGDMNREYLMSVYEMPHGDKAPRLKSYA
jgi:hypothetical protein